MAGTLILSVQALGLFAYSVDDKMKLEQWYASQATSVAENIVGKGKVVSFVHVYLETVQSQKAKDVYSINGMVKKTGDKSTVVWQNDARKNQQYLLPGFPVDETGNSAGQFPGQYEHISEQQFELPQTVITKMEVQMMVDSIVKDELLRELPGIIATTLSMDKARGDSIEIRKIPFPPQPGFLEQFRKPELIMDAAKFTVHTLVVILGVLLMYSVLRMFARSHLPEPKHLPGKEQMRHDVLDATVNIKPELGGGLPVPGTPAQGEAAMPIAAAPAAVSQDKQHFGFVNKNNIPRLAWLMRDEEAQNVAMTLSYLDPADSHFILSTISPERRNEVMQLLTQTFDMDPEKVTGWESLVRRKIDYVLSGPEMLMGMLDTIDEAARDRLLAEVSAKNPQLASDLREGMFLFEHIGYLDEKDIRQLLRNVPNEQLAIALQNMPDQLVQKILLTRTEGGQTILKEIMALSQKLPEKQVQESRHAIVKLARQLIKDGVITHKKPTRVDAFIV